MNTPAIDIIEAVDDDSEEDLSPVEQRLKRVIQERETELTYGWGVRCRPQVTALTTPPTIIDIFRWVPNMYSVHTNKNKALFQPGNCEDH